MSNSPNEGNFDRLEEGEIVTWQAGVGVTRRNATEFVSLHEDENKDKKNYGAADLMGYIKGKPR